MLSRQRMIPVAAIVLVLSAGAVILHALWTRTQDMSLDEALAADLRLPVYALDHTRLGLEDPLTARYFYVDYGDGYRLEAYFFVAGTEDTASPVAILAVMTLPEIVEGELIDQTAAIPWADENSAYTCEVWNRFDRGETAYQSCLLWRANRKFYKFFAVWPEAAAIRAANALEAVSTNH